MYNPFCLMVIHILTASSPYFFSPNYYLNAKWDGPVLFSGLTGNYIQSESQDDSLFSVVVDSKPRGARVFLSGTYKGTTPIELDSLLRGNYVLKLELEGYKSIILPLFIPTKRKTLTYNLVSIKEFDAYRTSLKKNRSISVLIYATSVSLGFASLTIDNYIKSRYEDYHVGLVSATYALFNPPDFPDLSSSEKLVRNLMVGSFLTSLVGMGVVSAEPIFLSEEPEGPSRQYLRMHYRKKKLVKSLISESIFLGIMSTIYYYWGKRYNKFIDAVNSAIKDEDIPGFYKPYYIDLRKELDTESRRFINYSKIGWASSLLLMFSSIFMTEATSIEELTNMEVNWGFDPLCMRPFLSVTWHGL